MNLSQSKYCPKVTAGGLCLFVNQSGYNTRSNKYDQNQIFICWKIQKYPYFSKRWTSTYQENCIHGFDESRDCPCLSPLFRHVLFSRGGSFNGCTRCYESQEYFYYVFVFARCGKGRINLYLTPQMVSFVASRINK